MDKFNFSKVITRCLFFIFLSGFITSSYNCKQSMVNVTGCPSTIPNASYTGPYKGTDNNLSTDDLAHDLYCAEAFKKNKYPGGFVTILGGSRIKEYADEEKNPLYSRVKTFAKKWSEHFAGQYPIMTGAGPGIMEAGSRGAMEAHAPSIGYTTYYGPSRKNGDAKMAFWKYVDPENNSHDIISDGIIFSSVAQREYLMIMHSAAILIAPGGTGTEWEIFQTLEQIKSNQLDPIPVYLVGSKKEYWQSFYNRLNEMIKHGTIDKGEVTSLFVHVENPEDVFDLLKRKMELN